MNLYDIIIIGSGPGGYTTAADAARLGNRTLIIERDKLGGTCLNRGCIPTKALCRSAEVAMMLKKAESFGVNTGEMTLDYRRAAERKRSVVEQLREGVALELRDVDIIYGEAKFITANTLAVGNHQFSAPKIIIATGSRPASLPIPGSELAVNSDSVLEITSLPQTMTIIGGGVIGMEFASIFTAFGVKVTLLEYCREILPGFDAEIAKRLRMLLKRRGITIITGAQVTAITPSLDVEYTEKDKHKSVASDMVLMAVGRRAVIPDGLEKLGIKLDRGFIAVDSSMATNLPGVYAIGDVNGRCLLAHAATAQGRVVLNTATEPDIIPAAIFTFPECAGVGLTSEKCTALNIETLEGKAIYRANGKALAMDETDGLLKIIVARDSDKILGCFACGAHAADIIQEVTVAMQAGMTTKQLAATVHIHPTLSELIETAITTISISN